MSENTELVKATENMLEERRQLVKITPVVDIYENEDEILLHADMPGVTKDQITVNVENGKLEISGIRKMQASGAERWREFGDVEYRRVFSVPQTIDVAKVNAELKHGVLKLSLPKSEAAKPRSIEIRTA